MSEIKAERLQQIDEEKEFNMCGYTGKLLSIELSNKDYSFLFTEAERAYQLDALIKTHAPEGRNYTNAKYVELLLENKRLREAINQALEKCRWNNEESARILEQALGVLE